MVAKLPRRLALTAAHPPRFIFQWTRFRPINRVKVFAFRSILTRIVIERNTLIAEQKWFIRPNDFNVL